jgi:D-threo-aldose 1-dehydrogenase
VSTIVGMSRPERLQQTLDLAAMRIPDELWARLDELTGPAVDPEAVRWQS